MLIFERRIRLATVYIGAAMISFLSASCYSYEGKFVAHLKIKNCSNQDQDVQVISGRHGSLEFTVPAGSEKLATLGDQCTQCGSDYSCAAISFKGVENKLLNFGNDGVTCPSELGHHELRITCNNSTCGAVKVSGDLNPSSNSGEPQC